MKQVKLKEVKKGEFFILNENPKLNEEGEVLSKYVYIKDEYNRSTKKYEVHKFNDVCDYKEMKGDRKVWIDFLF